MGHKQKKHIQNPDAITAGKPAREIFGDFSIMYSK